MTPTIDERIKILEAKYPESNTVLRHWPDGEWTLSIGILEHGAQSYVGKSVEECLVQAEKKLIGI